MAQRIVDPVAFKHHRKNLGFVEALLYESHVLKHREFLRVLRKLHTPRVIPVRRWKCAEQQKLNEQKMEALREFLDAGKKSPGVIASHLHKPLDMLYYAVSDDAITKPANAYAAYRAAWEIEAYLLGR